MDCYKYQLDQLQSIITAAARMIIELLSMIMLRHCWLRVQPERIDFKLCSLVYKPTSLTDDSEWRLWSYISRPCDTSCDTGLDDSRSTRLHHSSVNRLIILYCDEDMSVLQNSLTLTTHVHTFDSVACSCIALCACNTWIVNVYRVMIRSYWQTMHRCYNLQPLSYTLYRWLFHSLSILWNLLRLSHCRQFSTSYWGHCGQGLKSRFWDWLSSGYSK